MSTVAPLPFTEALAPADAAEVANAVRAAVEKGATVYPLGGGTAADADIVAARPGIGLSTAKLNRLVDYPSDDMTVTVEAGMTIAELQRLLAEKRQWLPIDVGWPERATVGGAIARNAAGPRSYAYGSMRDYVLGFTAVDGTGMVFSGGGRVVKNAAGYNMCRLITGSFGSLGIITQATLMVRPLAETASVLACDVPDFELLEKLLAGLVRSAARPAAIELSAGRPHDGVPLLGPMADGAVGRLCVGLEGPAVEVDWMVDRLCEEWVDLGVTAPTTHAHVDAEPLWRWFAEFPAKARIAVLPSRLVETVAGLRKADANGSIQARAGDGVIFTTTAVEESEPKGGDAPLGPERRVMRAIEERFDPKRLLQPLARR